MGQLPQVVVAGLMMGALYALMAVGITFIYSLMKMINWAMGEFYMVGSYAQFVLVTLVLGPSLWFLGIPLSMVGVFLLGLAIQRGLLAPMFGREADRRDEYATIVTIALSVLGQNLATILAGPYQWSPPEYLPLVAVGGVSVNGSRLAAAAGALVILAGFYILVRRTWLGLAFLGAAQNRVGAEVAGIDVRRLDALAFGIGVALAAAAGALLAPVFLVYPTNGAVSTVKGFEVIVIGGLGSLTGSVVAAFLLGLVESFGSVFISPAYQDLYGFIFLIAMLFLRPQGIFGERERRV